MRPQNCIGRLNATPCGSELVREGCIPDDTFLADVPAPSRKSPLPLGQNQKQTSVRGVGANLSKPVKQNQKRAGV
ncbi:hypothetical protein B0B36_12375 [Pseudomonas syringae pv. actinidifoliorum]|nr:hypothetical protein B0B36_12375 [Pseudomonas syringae pv. actinidifoliorum]